ncbi:MAG: TolC family protein [Bacteroidota bacterium]
MRRIGFTFLLLLTGLSLRAQQAWTLQQCIDHALSHNLQVRQSELSVDQNKSQVQQSTATLFPSVNGSASQSYFFGRSIDPFTNVFANQQITNNNFNLNASMSIFEGFQLMNTLRQSKLNYMASRADLDKIRNDIALNVATAYLQVLYNEDLVGVAEGQLESSRQQRDRAKRQYELGAIAQSGYLDLESQFATDDLNLVNARAQLAQSRLSLTQLLELDSVSNFQITRPDVLLPAWDATSASVEVVFNAAMTNQPEIRASEYRYLSAERGLSIARGTRYPRLSVSGNLNTNISSSAQEVTGFLALPPSIVESGFTSGGDTVYSVVPNNVIQTRETPFSKQFEDNLGKSVGFTLSVPIFNGWAARNNVTRARIGLEQARISREQTRKTLYKSVQQAVTDAHAASARYESGNRSLSALERSFEENRKRFEVGAISTYDFLLVQNNLARTRATALQNKYDFLFRLKVLDFYQGKPLSF